MGLIALFVLGLLVGWLAEWIIDWFYWRGRIQAAAEKNAELTQDNARLSQENARLTQNSAALPQENAELAQENVSLRERIASLEQELKTRPPSVDLSFLTDKEGNDNFQAIKGIGPAFSNRLREADIHTFEGLSKLTPGELEEILGTLFKRFFSKENNILARAKEFAQLKGQTRQQAQ